MSSFFINTLRFNFNIKFINIESEKNKMSKKHTAQSLILLERTFSAQVSLTDVFTIFQKKIF